MVRYLIKALVKADTSLTRKDSGYTQMLVDSKLVEYMATIKNDLDLKPVVVKFFNKRALSVFGKMNIAIDRRENNGT
jgi:hypothetical protein